jgi:BirA family transcriptional regulator, biotin operon repressor / biotin---[acetyl-CoA-carboxylase] ligase
VGLNQQQLEAALKVGRESPFLPFSLHVFDSVSSTNQVISDLIAQGAEPGTVVIATQQTAGRGQWGRQWISPEGGLYLSVAISGQIEASNSYQLTLASAWGIANQLRKCGVSVGIKWPNDLVLNNRKLGGILTETKVQQKQIVQAVIGVGINWKNPVPETGVNLEMWQASEQTKPITSLEMLASVVLLGIESGLKSLFEEGVSILLPRYLDLLVNIGDTVYVNNLAGTVVGINTDGHLRVLMKSNSTNTVKTPEIHLQPGTISLGYRKSSN